MRAIHEGPFNMKMLCQRRVLCRELVIVVTCSNRGIIQARDIAIHHLRKYPTFRMLHSLGWPLFYIYTLTVDGRTTDATGTNLYRSASGRRLPVPGQPSGRRQPFYKCIPDRACVSLGHLPGWRTDSPYPGLSSSLHRNQPLPTDWGVCAARKTNLELDVET